MKCKLRICWGVKLAAVPDSGELVAIKKFANSLLRSIQYIMTGAGKNMLVLKINMRND